MELRVMKYFLAVAEEGNITKAADRLHLTQPTLSRQLRELEEELGAPLFVRGKRRIALTEGVFFLKPGLRKSWRWKNGRFMSFPIWGKP